MTQMDSDRPPPKFDDGTDLPYEVTVGDLIGGGQPIIPKGGCKGSNPINTGSDRTIRINYTASPHEATLSILEGSITRASSKGRSGSLSASM